MSPICHFLALNAPVLATAPSSKAKLPGQAWGPRVATWAGALGTGSRQGVLLPFCLSHHHLSVLSPAWPRSQPCTVGPWHE